MKTKVKIAECAEHPESKDFMVRILGQVYWVKRLCEDEYDRIIGPVNSIRRDPKTLRLVCDRKRDFGGCGKDAYKMEVNVPIGVWLGEVYAHSAECGLCGAPAIKFDLEPVCEVCSV